MQYYRNSEAAKLFGVSQATVGKWVEKATKGELDLAMVKDGDKAYIAATSGNRTTIEAMVKERKKYYSRNNYKVIRPGSTFYETFTPEQVDDIIINLKRGELPLQYNYFGDGAYRFENYVLQRAKEESDPKSATFAAVKQLEQNRGYIDSILARFANVNLIDIGPGNVLPVKGLLTHLVNHGKLGRYLAIDISPDMLAVAHRNTKDWFGKDFPFDADIRDITYEPFRDLLMDTLPDTVNLVTFMGGTLGNFNWPSDALRVIHRSLGTNSFLIYNLKLDAEPNRLTFDFDPDTNTAPLPMGGFALELLGVDHALFDVEAGFDVGTAERYARIHFKLAVVIEIALGKRIYRVSFRKGESLLVWRYKHQDTHEVLTQFRENGFNVKLASETEDGEFLMLMCDIKAKA